MAPTEIRLEIGDQEISMPELQKGEERVFHFEKPLHRGLKVECTDKDATKVRVWGLQHPNERAEISFVPNQFTKSEAVINAADDKGESITVDLGFGVKAQIRNRKYWQPPENKV